MNMPGMPNLARALMHAMAVVLVIGAGAFPAVAASHSEAAVRELLEDLLLAFVRTGGTAIFRSNGESRIVQSSDDAEYGITLPGVKAFLGENRVWNLGNVAFGIADQGGGRFILSGALPPATRLFDTLEAPVADISIGEQSLEGTWNSNTFAFDDSHVRLADIRYDRAGGGFLWRFGSVASESVTKPTASALWWQRSRAELRDVAVAGPAEGTSTRITRVFGTYLAEDLRLEERVRLLRILRQDGGAQGQSLLAEYVTALTARPDLLPDRVRVILVLDGVASNVVTPVDLTLRAAEFNLALQDLAQPAGTMGVALAYEGLHVPAGLAASLGDPMLAADLIPQQATLRTTTTNIPTQAIRGAFLSRDPAELEQDAAAGFITQREKILRAMSDARTRVAFDSVRLESARLILEGEGSFDVDLQDMHGAVGSGRLTVRGLNDYLSSLVLRRSPNSLAALTIVGVMIALGEAIEDETGPAHAFDIELTRAGALLINGQDLESLFPDE